MSKIVFSKLFSNIEAMSNVTTRLNAYMVLLSKPGLKNAFSREEIGDVFYNYSLDYAIYAEACFEKGEYQNAFSTMWAAKSAMHDAYIRYSTRYKRQACNTQLEKFDVLRDTYRMHLPSHATRDEKPLKRKNTPERDEPSLKKRKSSYKPRLFSNVVSDETPSTNITTAEAISEAAMNA